ncbi:serine/threonine protein phosphatase [Antrihabitans spumae]|uniref:Serine/threonine protein phosphatase n=1 Tax=Antrihabitans spumae TaxID=3373370 RepID=A0ABW7KWU4_9NOCA
MTALRADRYRQINAHLFSCSDFELVELLDNGSSASVGIGGGSAVLYVDGVPVFAKRIPLTDLEIAHRGSTANLFDLPVFCQYGIGGPSFNAWRELAANKIVTDGVLAGETQSFPMLYHWRVLRGRSPIADEHADINAVVAAQGNNPAVRGRLEALAAAQSSLVLFGEYIEHPLLDWLRRNPVGTADAVAEHLSEIVTFLADRKLLHMDGHFDNMRSDGERIYLCDFGLATSPTFDLSTAERDFAERHAAHDADYAAMRLVNWLVTDVCGVPIPSSGGPLASGFHRNSV